MRIEHFAVAGYTLILCACYPSAVTPTVEATSTNTPIPAPTFTPPTTPAPRTEAQQYLSDALDIIQENAYHSRKMDWANLRPKLLMAAKDAKSPADTYSLIRYVLGEVDRHSSLFTPAEAEDLISAEASDFIAPSGKLVEGRLGYVALFGFQVIDETPVAVLIGEGTISAGEFTTISFRGRPNTRFFGKPSRGFSTGNQGFLLSDGAFIKLTTCIGVDRTGQGYGGKILPDVTTSMPEQDAAAWLLAQPACAQD